MSQLCTFNIIVTFKIFKTCDYISFQGNILNNFLYTRKRKKIDEEKEKY